MKVYHYDLEGYYQSDSSAFPDPLTPGEYLVPAHSTLIAPPEAKPKQAARWLGDHWELVDCPKHLLEQEKLTAKKLVIYYRDIPGKDTKILSIAKWGEVTSHWKDAEPVYKGKLVSASSGIGWCLVDHDDSFDYLARNLNGEHLKKVINGNVVDRDPADVNSDDATYKNTRKVVFFRKSAGKDSKIIKVSDFGSTSDSKGSVIFDGRPVPDGVAFKILDEVPGNIFSPEGVSLLKLVDGKFVPRASDDFEKDPEWKSHLDKKCNQQIRDLLGDQALVEMMDVSHDVHALLKSVMAHLGITDGHLEAALPGSSSAKNRIEAFLKTHQKINKIRSEKDLALSKLEK